MRILRLTPGQFSLMFSIPSHNGRRKGVNGAFLHGLNQIYEKNHLEFERIFRELAEKRYFCVPI
jgi:hypothetical protein